MLSLGIAFLLIITLTGLGLILIFLFLLFSFLFPGALSFIIIIHLTIFNHLFAPTLKWY